MAAPRTKRCTACGRPAEAGPDGAVLNFYPSRKSKDGLQSRCKTCEAERDRRPRRRKGPAKHCELCCGMAHARPPEGCPAPPEGCGLPFVAEQIPPGPTHRF